MSLFGYVIGDALAIAVVSLVVTVSMGKLFAKKHNYEVDVKQVSSLSLLQVEPCKHSQK